jgi:hypothetical protein
MSPLPESPPIDPAHRERMASLLQELDEQVARLALSLGLALAERQGLLEAMRQTPLHPDDPPRQQRHDAHHAELRGLLVLRYELIGRYVNEIGPDATRALLIEAEQRLLAEGFAPGADGMHLDTLFGPA